MFANIPREPSSLLLVALTFSQLTNNHRAMPEKYTSDCSNLFSARRTLSYTCPFPASRVWGNKNLRFDRRFAGYEEKTWAVYRWYSLLAPRVSRIAVLATIPNRERAPRTFLLFSVLFSFSLLVLFHRFPTKTSVYSSTNQRERTRTLSTDPDDRKGDECDTVASSLTISTAKRFVTYSYCFFLRLVWCCFLLRFFFN